MTSAAISQAYLAARERAALITRTRGLIVVSGQDRRTYLQGLLTNDVAALQPGQGCYAAYLTAQGRMVSDLHVYELGDVILLALPRTTTATVLAKLDQFIFSEDVQLSDVSDSLEAVAVVGPEAARVLSPLVGAERAELVGLFDHGNLRRIVDGQPLIVLRVTDTGEPGYELIAGRHQMPALLQALHTAGAIDLNADTAEVLRVEEGVPMFGQDMDEDTIPLEAGIEQQAISFTKGCYVGQEVIIRVMHRGHGRVARRLVGLLLGGDDQVPPPGTTLHADDREVGVVTSSALSPALGCPIALGYVKRDVLESGASLLTSPGALVRVVPLPFRTA